MAKSKVPKNAYPLILDEPGYFLGYPILDFFLKTLGISEIWNPGLRQIQTRVMEHFVVNINLI